MGCDDEKTVTPPQSSMDAEPEPDVGPLPDSGEGDAAGDAGPPPPPPDAGLCAPPSPPEPAAPEGRCDALAEADPFADVPCGAPLALPGMSAPAQVVFTEMGVPHVYAASLADAVRVQGYLVARDRFFELDLTRRATLGRLSGWLSELALETDIENRTQGQAAAAQRTLAAGTSPEMLALFEAYAEGVNFYIVRVNAGLDPRPEEFLPLADIITLQPAERLFERWTALDVAAGAAAITYALAFDGEDLGRSLALADAGRYGQGLPRPELRNAAAVTDVMGDLRPITRTAQTGAGLMKPGEAAQPSRKGLAVPAGLRGAVERLRTRWAARRDPDADRGSNTWAVDAAHGDGAALLASDPHLDLGAPTFFYQIHMDTALLGPAGPDALQAAGVSLPGTPFVVIGHTDRLAWGITNLNADDTDFYLERVTLQNGRPAATVGPGGAVHLMRAVDESYTISQAPLAGVPATRTCTIARFETQDARMLVALEGTPVDDVDCSAPPEGAVNISGQWLVPGDVDADGLVTGVSLDFTGLDPNPLAHTVEGYLRARNIDDFMQAQRHSGVFNNAQAVADVEGRIATTGFHAVPRRDYLRGEDGGWAEGGDPTYLIDATRFPSFQVTLDDELRVVTESDDPSKRMISFEDWPRLVDPERGFVVSANNDLTGGTFDGDTGNDDPYVGWNYDIGFRAERITELLAGFVEAGRAIGVAEMARVQNDHHSNFGRATLERLLADLGEGCAHPLAGEATARLAAWSERGFEAASGVETFYHRLLGPTEPDDAAATAIFNEWLAFLLRAVLDDEQLDGVHWNGGGTDARARLLARLLHAPEEMAGYDAEAADHVYWDDATTADVEARGAILCRALGAALDHLQTGFGSDDPNAWAWGLRHTVKFTHQFEPVLGDNDILGPTVRGYSIGPATLPVAACVPADDPRLSLPGYPRPGDHFAVDASTPGWNPDDWSYDSGPVQRLVVRLEDGNIRGEVILPGGQSGFPGTAHWADQARVWLANERRPIHFRTEDVAAHARERLVLRPPP